MVKKNEKKRSVSQMSSVESEDSVLDLKVLGEVSHRGKLVDKNGISSTMIGRRTNNVPHISVQSGIVKRTSTQSRPTTRTSRKNGNQATSPKSTHQASLTSICSVEDSPASLFRLLENGRVSRILEVLFSLNSVVSPKRKDLDCFSLKTSKDSLTTIRGRPLERSSVRFLNWGMMSNGRCVTVRTSVSRRTGNGCSLSDILEPNEYVDEKYFLSEKAIKGIMNHQQRHREKGNGFGEHIHILESGVET